LQSNLLTCAELLKEFQGRITRRQLIKAVQAGRIKVYVLKGQSYYDPRQVSLAT